MSVLTIRQTVPLGPDAHGRDRGRLADDAAASVFRIDAQLERPLDINSAWRSPATQQAMYLAWRAYVEGRGPKPDHGRALPADQSVHCRGYAIDTDDSRYAALLGAHGWFRTAADESWHFEYDRTRDRHRHDGTPTGNGSTSLPEQSEEDEMNPRQIHYKAPGGKIIRALLVPGTGYFVKWTESGATYANNLARNMETNSSSEVTASLFGVFEREAIAQRPKDALTIELAEA